MRDIRSAAAVATFNDSWIASTTEREQELVIFCSSKGRWACIRAPSYVSWRVAACKMIVSAWYLVRCGNPLICC